jgi:hypothetical protein
MAVSSGTGQHRAWVSVNGQRFPLLGGSVDQAATSKSSTFSGQIPLGYTAAELTFGTLNQNDSSIIVQTRDAEKSLVSGEIDRIDFDYIGGVISFSGRCKSAKLHEKKSSEKWVNKKHHEIVKDLAGRVGLKTDLDESTLNAGRIMQLDWSKMTDGSSYATVIHKMAEIMGARWWVKDDTLYMKTTDNPAGFYTITYDEGPPKTADFKQLRISRNIQAGKSVKVNVKSFHAGKKQTFAGSYTIGGAGGTVEYNYHLPGHTQGHVDKHAKSKAKDHARHELSVVAEMVGDPAIDVGMKLRLQGTMFAQDFDMDSVHHAIGMSGHSMTIHAKSAKKGRS